MGKRNLRLIDIADIAEVRKGYSTDAFNAVEKRVKKSETEETPTKYPRCSKTTVDQCFSIIFDKRIRTKPLDLVADDVRTCDIWIKTIRSLVSATKNVEAQKEHENFLRKQFQAADSRGSGFLLIDEFAELLRQLNIEQLSRTEIKEIFDEINTDQTTEFDGQQVIDEREFLLFYHDLMERDEIYLIFDCYAKTHRGASMTLRELKRFLSVEQRIPEVNLDECRHIVRDFEPSAEKRRENLLSPQGFSHFMIFSDYHDIVEPSHVEQVREKIHTTQMTKKNCST